MEITNLVLPWYPNRVLFEIGRYLSSFVGMFHGPLFRVHWRYQQIESIFSLLLRMYNRRCQLPNRDRNWSQQETRSLCPEDYQRNGEDPQDKNPKIWIDHWSPFQKLPNLEIFSGAFDIFHRASQFLARSEASQLCLYQRQGFKNCRIVPWGEAVNPTWDLRKICQGGQQTWVWRSPSCSEGGQHQGCYEILCRMWDLPEPLWPSLPNEEVWRSERSVYRISDRI